ncbi:MAG: DUF4112 domain-containing protein [Pseudomonadota bacterium]
MTDKTDDPVFERIETDPAFDGDEALRIRIERLARLLDAEFSAFGFRFGLDGLIGLIPGIGDAATSIIAFYIIIEAARAGAGPILLGRMVINVVIDLILGAVPFFGDVFDFAFRANAMNARLLSDFLHERHRR